MENKTGKKFINSRDLPLSKRPLPNVFDKEKLIKIFEAIKDPKLMVAVFLGFSCGMRISEVCKLKVAEVHIKERKVKIHQSKFNKDRVIYIAKEEWIPIFEKWLSYINKIKSPYVIPSTYNPYKPMSSGALSGAFVSVLESINLYIPFKEKSDGQMQHMYTFHTLRHSFCTYMIKKGVPLPHVQRLMGHCDIKITQRYTHIEDTDIMEKMDEIFNMRQARHAESFSEGKIKDLSQFNTSKIESPLVQLKMRLVNGEINAEKYKELLRLIEPEIQSKEDFAYIG